MAVGTRLTVSGPRNEQRPLLAAFAGSAETAQQLQQVGAHLSRYQHYVSQGGIGAAIRYCRSQRSPELLVLDICAEAEPLQALDQLANYCEAHTRVIVVGSHNDIGFYQRMMQMGVSEYLPLPLDADRYQYAARVALGEQPAVDQVRGKRIAVYGCRGGVGVTLLAANLAWHLSQTLRASTALLDLDLHQGDLDLLLGFTASDRLERVMTRVEDIEDLQLLERAGEQLAERLSVYKNRHARLPPDPDTARQRIRQLCELHSRVVLDLPRSQSGLSRQLLLEAELRVVVLEPGLSTLRDATELLQQLGEDAAGQRTLLVLNYTRPEKHCMISQAQVEQTLRRPVDFVLPWMPERTAQAQDLGVPLVSQSHRLSQQIAALAEDLLGHKAVVSRHNPLTRLLQRLKPEPSDVRT
ncbi:MAG: hypothetical protein OIF57_01145 [Marinobacterium sp.]|nr:hypothetical protein [Marinobacterium sp.]